MRAARTAPTDRQQQAERALEHAHQLQEAAAALGRAITPQAVGDAIVSGAMTALEADRAIVAELLEGGTTLRVLAARGYPDELIEHWREFSVEVPSPMTEAIHTRAPVVVSTRREVLERWPGLSGGPATSQGEANLTVPLLLDEGVLGALSLGFPDARDFDDADLTFAATHARQSAIALERARLNAARERSRRDAETAVAQLMIVSRASELLASSTDYPATFVRLGELLVEGMADFCVIDLRAEDGSIARVAAVHRDAAKQPLVDELRKRYAPLAAGSHPVTRVLQTGQPEFAAEMTDAFLRETTRDADHFRIARTLDVQSFMCVPLVARDRILGTILFVSTDPARRYGPRDVELAREIARRAAVRADNARLFQLEQGARLQAEAAVARLTLVSRVSELLAIITDYPAAFVRLAEVVVESLADLCLIDVADGAGGIERVASVTRSRGQQHLADALRERFAPLTTGQHPASRVIRTGEAAWSGEMSDTLLEEITQDDEHLRIVRELGFQSFVCVPLLGRDRVLGAITFVSTDPAHRYGPADLEMAREIARRASVRADNARLFQREQQARMEAEAARRQLTFLADATRLLVSSLDYDVTLNRLAELAVPGLADWCVIQLAGEGRQIETVALAHVDPDKVALARALGERYPPDPDAPVGAGKVIRTGEPELIPEIPERLLEELVSEPELLAIVRDLHLRSSMVVPLTARGHVLGALTLVAAESGRTYDEGDLMVAEELGRRAGIAIDNARLFRERDYIAQTLQRTLLPPKLPDISGVELEARYFPLPTNEVGGDFYDVFDAGGGAWSIALGDVCGKGPDAAAVMGVARVTIRTAAAHESRPSDVLRTMNEILMSQGTEQRFCTACYARLRMTETGGRLTLSCGGHPLPIVIRASGSAHVVGQFGSLLGVLPDPTLFDVAVDLARGDAIVFYTDGILDERNAGQGGGEDHLLEVLTWGAGRSAAEVAGALERYLAENRSALPRDDAAFLVIRVLP